MSGGGIADRGSIEGRLDDDESIVAAASQVRGDPAASGLATIYATEKRIIIVNPAVIRSGGYVEEYYYHRIDGVELRKGETASLTFTIQDMGEISQLAKTTLDWGRDDRGVIGSRPPEPAERVYGFVRQRADDVRKFMKETKFAFEWSDDPAKDFQRSYERGEIDDEMYEEIKKFLGI